MVSVLLQILQALIFEVKHQLVSSSSMWRLWPETSFKYIVILSLMVINNAIYQICTSLINFVVSAVEWKGKRERGERVEREGMEGTGGKGEGRIGIVREKKGDDIPCLNQYVPYYNSRQQWICVSYDVYAIITHVFAD